MKRSEIAAAIRAQLEAMVRMRTWESSPAVEWARAVSNDEAVSIAAALGVTVEPDEPALPDQVFLGDAQDHTPRWGKERGNYAAMPDGWSAFSLRSECNGLHTHRGCLVADRALADALLAAYNERPRPDRIIWHIGEPNEAGDYLVEGRPAEEPSMVYHSGGRWDSSWAEGRRWAHMPQKAREEKP